MPIVADRALVTFDTPGAGGYGATVTYTAYCVSCELDI
jgi:hypothetical protein